MLNHYRRLPLILTFLTLSAGACITTKPYVPKRSNVVDPAGNLEFALMRHCSIAPASVEHGKGYTKVSWVSGISAWTETIIYDEIDTVRIQEDSFNHLGTRTVYRLLLGDKQGSDEKRFDTKSLESAQALADAIAALAPNMGGSPE